MSQSVCLEKGEIVWPFKYINDEQTPESKALEALPPEKPRSVYKQCMDDNPEDALL